MSFLAVAVGVGTVGGALVAGGAAKDAAKTQANSIRDASEISAEAARVARQDVFNLFNPALADFSTGIQQSISALIGGQTTPTEVATQTPNIQPFDDLRTSAPTLVEFRRQQALQAQQEQQAQPFPGNLTAPVGGEALQAQQEQPFSAASLTTPVRGGGVQQPTTQAGQPSTISGEARGGAFGGGGGFGGIGGIAGSALGGIQQPILQQLPPTQQVPGQEQFGALPALGALQQGFGQARQDINLGRERAIAPLQQFADVGGQAFQQEAALSGALGPEAQQAAINAFTESPGQQFLRGRQEQSLLRNQAAIGGLGGGNVRTALQEQAFGIASTQQQQQLQNLASLAGRGQTAATGISQIEGQQGSNLANIASQLGISEAQLRQTVGADISNLLAQQAQGQANLRTSAGQLLSNIATGQGTAQAGFAQNIGTARAAGQLGQASAITQGVGQLANVAGQFFGQQPQQPNPFITNQNPLGLTPGQGL